MENLASHKKLLKALFQSAAEGILVVDRQGSIVLANPRCLQMFGYTHDELVGQSLEILVTPGLQAAHAGFREGFFQDPKIRPMGVGRKLYGRTAAGEVFPLEVSLSHMEVDGARYAIGFIVDITKQKQAADENILLSKIFHESFNDIYIIDAQNYRILKANTGALKNIGYTLEELQELVAWDLKPDQDQTDFLQRVAPLLSGEKKKIIFESVFVRKDHSSFPAEIHMQLFDHEDRQVFMETVLDISERKQAEAALQREKETAQRYLDIAASIFVVLDREGTVMLFNRKGSQILGFEEEEVIGKNWFDYFLSEEEKEKGQQIFKRVMQGEMDVIEIYENNVLTKNREERPIAWYNSLIRDEQEQPIAVLSSGVDLTEKRKAERDVMKALIEGQEVERERIAKEMHDGLGQSLTAMQLNLNALQAHCEHVAPEAKQLFEQLKGILYNTTQEIKSISRNLMPGVLRDYGLVQGLEYLCQTLKDINLIQVNLQVYRMDKKLDSIQSIGLYRIAQELINNTLKHGKASEIHVQLIGHENSVVLMVEDDGTGFDPTVSHVKNGLGLKNMETRVKTLNGTFLIDSYPGKGTSVTVEIPIHKE